MPGSAAIKTVSVSIDAGTSDVYKEVRGGDWNILMKNLEWLSTLRHKRQLKWFSINFTVRRANFRTMKKFVDLGVTLGVDKVRFDEFHPWDRMKVKNFESEAVHQKNHPDFAEFQEICSELEKNPLVDFKLSLRGH